MSAIKKIIIIIDRFLLRVNSVKQGIPNCLSSFKTLNKLITRLVYLLLIQLVVYEAIVS